MTDILIKKHNGNIKSVSVSGHTGYAQEGEDILCAAISSIVQTALLGLLSVAKINVEFERDAQEGKLSFSLPQNLSESTFHDAQVILDTMLCGLSDLYTEYSDFMNLEVL